MSTPKNLKLHQIVRVFQIVKKWHKLARVRKRLTSIGSALSPRSSFRRRASCDSDDDCPCESPPPDVPAGFFALYVGDQRKRYIVETRYLTHPLFLALLKKAEEEFGFDHVGGLTIPCDTLLFDNLLGVLRTADSAVRKHALNGFPCAVES